MYTYTTVYNIKYITENKNLAELSKTQPRCRLTKNFVDSQQMKIFLLIVVSAIRNFAWKIITFFFLRTIVFFRQKVAEQLNLKTAPKPQKNY